MYYILYSSYEAVEFDDMSLRELLVQAREKNKSLGITGMLFYFRKQFLQLIEGDLAIVSRLGKEIAEDPRHKYFTILKEGEIEVRFFEDWFMGFKSIDSENLRDVQNFKELSSPGVAASSPFVSLMKILSTAP